jgi:hypothetical protein
MEIHANASAAKHDSLGLEAQSLVEATFSW